MTVESILQFPGNHVCAPIFVSCDSILFQDGSDDDFVCLCIFRRILQLDCEGTIIPLQNITRKYGILD